MDYKVSVENLNDVDRKILIEIPREIYNEKFDKQLNRAVTGVQLKGFRKGRAPKAMVAKMVGEKIHYDVLENLVSDAVRDAVTKHSLNIVGTPKIDIDDSDSDKALVIRADVSIYPEPEIEDYFGVEFEAQIQEFNDEIIDQRLENLREMKAEYVEIEGKQVVDSGDCVMVDYDGEVDGRKLKREGEYLQTGEKTSNGAIGDMIAASLVGTKVGDQFDAEINLPAAKASDESSADAEEQPAAEPEKISQVKINVRGIYRRNLPELSDEFAKETQLADDLAGLKEHIRTEAEREIAHYNEQNRREGMFRALVAKNEFAVPQALVDREIRYILMEMNLLDPKDDRSYRVDVDHFREPLNEGAEYRVRRGLILGKILEKEAPEVSDEMLSAWLDKRAEEQGVERARIENAYNYPAEASRLKELVAETTVVELLLERAKIKEVSVNQNAGGN